MTEKPYTETARFKKLAKEYNQEMDKVFPVKRQYTKSKRQNKDAKTSRETPPDKRGNFYLSENVQDWYGCNATKNHPCLF